MHHHHHQAGGQETVRHREPHRVRRDIGVTTIAAAAAAVKGHRELRPEHRRRHGRRRYIAPVPVHRAGDVPSGTVDDAVRAASRGRRGGDGVPRPSPSYATAAPSTAAAATPASTTLFTVRGLIFSAELIVRRKYYGRLALDKYIPTHTYRLRFGKVDCDFPVVCF